MKVSIITPAYNSELSIKNTISSIQEQTLTDWELIIIDDGSTDNSAKIVESIALSDQRIKLVQKKNGGSASARKVGLTLAQGEYIQFLDADDTIDTEKLQKQIEFMEKNQLDVSYTDWRMVDTDNQIYPTKGFDCSLARILTTWGTFGTLPLHSFIYKRTFLNNNNISIPTHIKEREDWDFHIEVFSAKPKHLRLCGFCGAMYTKSPAGKTTGASVEKIQLGTFKYLIYKISTTTGVKKALLCLRFSTELCFWFLRKIRYNNQQSLSSYCNHPQFKKIFTIGVLLLPISMIITIVSIIKLHLQLHKTSKQRQ